MKKNISFESEGLKLVGDFYFHDRNAPTLILLHGMCYYSFEYEGLASMLLEKGFNCLVFDFRCHGGSEGKRGDWRLNGLVADVISALDFLENEVDGPIGVFGNSLGGVVAVYAAAQDSRIKALACCNTATKPSRALYTPLRRWLLVFMKSISKVIPFTVNISYFIPRSLVLSDEEIIERVENDPKVFESRSFTAETYSEMIRWDASREVKKVHAPILVIHGKHDKLQPVSQSELLYESASEPKKLTLIEAGHVPTLEQTGELYHVLSDWFEPKLSAAGAL
jgi:uncharacterized protein